MILVYISLIVLGLCIIGLCWLIIQQSKQKEELIIKIKQEIKQKEKEELNEN